MWYVVVICWIVSNCIPSFHSSFWIASIFAMSEGVWEVGVDGVEGEFKGWEFRIEDGMLFSSIRFRMLLTSSV